MTNGTPTTEAAAHDWQKRSMADHVKYRDEEWTKDYNFLMTKTATFFAEYMRMEMQGVGICWIPKAACRECLQRDRSQS